MNISNILTFLYLHKGHWSLLCFFCPYDLFLYHWPCFVRVKLFIFQIEIYYSCLITSFYCIFQELHLKERIPWDKYRCVNNHWVYQVKHFLTLVPPSQVNPTIFFYLFHFSINKISDKDNLWAYLPLVWVIPLCKWPVLRLAQWCYVANKISSFFANIHRSKLKIP